MNRRRYKSHKSYRVRDFEDCKGISDLRCVDAGVAGAEVDDLVAGVFLEHQLHFGNLNPADLGTCGVAYGLVRGQDMQFLAHKLLDFDLSLSLVTVDHVA